MSSRYELLRRELLVKRLADARRCARGWLADTSFRLSTRKNFARGFIATAGWARRELERAA